MKHFIVLVILAASLSACITIVSPQPTYTPYPTYTPFPTPQPVANSSPFAPLPVQTRASAPGDLAVQSPVATACISWQDAAAHLNETTCVRGVVFATNKSGSTFFIDFDNSRSSFYGVSFKYTWDNLKGQCVELYGKITPYRDRPQIIIESQSQLALCRQ